ncbi:MAG: NAD(P)-dependent oxidoreductase [Propionibacteriales bacterium]|nr:NAD(P)-dependent oxidoreductase [Propionibacteriales bacterium]
MKIAFLGLGRMGRELATHLVTDGHDVTVWNRTSAATADLVERGADAATDAADAVAGVEVVVTALFGPDAVRDVVIGPDLNMSQETLWIDTTTISPADATAFAEWAQRRGAQYVHAPVIGSLAPARARTLGVLVGGNREAVHRARELLVWADPARVKTYDTPAKAAVAKLIANLALAFSMQGIVEALRLGRSNEMSTDDVLSTLDLTTLAPLKNLKDKMIRHDSYDQTQFSADLLVKDLRLVMHSSDYPLPALAAVFESLQTAVRSGHGDDDFAVIAAPDA